MIRNDEITSTDMLTFGISAGLSQVNGFGVKGSDLSSFVNCVWTAGKTNSAECKTNATYGAIIAGAKSVFGILNYAAGFGGVTAKAEDDTSGSNKNIKTGVEESVQITNVHNQELKQILQDIKEQEKVISDSIEEIEKLTNEKLTEQKEKLEANKKKIGDEIKEMNAETDPAEKQKHVDKIKEFQGAITGLGVEVAGLLTTVSAETATVTTAEGNIITKSGEATEKIQEALNNISGTTATVSKEGVANIKYGAEGAKEESTGAALEAAAAAAASAGIVTFGASTIEAGKLSAQAADYLAGGAKHISGAATNLTELSGALGKMGTEYAEIAADVQVVGSVLAESSALIGRFGTSVTGAITSIGSWDNISCVDKDLTKELGNYEKLLATYTNATPMNDLSAQSAFLSENGSEADENYQNNREGAIQESLKDLKFEFDLEQYTDGIGATEKA